MGFHTVFPQITSQHPNGIPALFEGLLGPRLPKMETFHSFLQDYYTLCYCSLNQEGDEEKNVDNIRVKKDNLES